jgi:hypothetical protein
MNAYKHFTDENTEGYDAVQLDILNRMFREACDEAGVDPCDPDTNESLLDHLAEKTLSDYDTSRGL